MLKKHLHYETKYIHFIIHHSKNMFSSFNVVLPFKTQYHHLFPSIKYIFKDSFLISLITFLTLNWFFKIAPHSLIFPFFLLLIHFCHLPSEMLSSANVKRFKPTLVQHLISILSFIPNCPLWVINISKTQIRPLYVLLVPICAPIPNCHKVSTTFPTETTSHNSIFFSSPIPIFP